MGPLCISCWFMCLLSSRTLPVIGLFTPFLGTACTYSHSLLSLNSPCSYTLVSFPLGARVLWQLFIDENRDVSAYFRDDSFCITLYMWDQIILVLSSYIFLTHLFNLVYVIGQYTLCLCIREVGLIIKRLKWKLADMIQIWITVFTIGESFMMISCVFDRYCTGYLVSLAQMKILL